MGKYQKTLCVGSNTPKPIVACGDVWLDTGVEGEVTVNMYTDGDWRRIAVVGDDFLHQVLMLHPVQNDDSSA